MYKDVVKRVTAWVLVLCMMGSIPDFSLWAASTGSGGHSYALENDGNMEIINTSATRATITNTFTMDSNDSTTLHTQTLTSVSFALNNTMNSLGDSGRYIATADYTIEVTGGGKTWTTNGEYKAQETLGKGRFTVNVGADDTIQFGPGDQVSVAVTVDNAKWRGDDGQEDPSRNTVSFRVADRTGNGTSTCDQAVFNKAACIRMTTVETASADETTAIAFKDGTPEAVAIGDTAQLELDFTPNTANDRDIVWSSSDSGIATVDADGRVTGVARGRVTITAALRSKPVGVNATREISVCKDMSSPDININSGAGIANQLYTGQALEPSVGVFDGTTQLQPHTHYYYDFEDNINAGTAKMVLTGAIDNGYVGTREVPFTIDRASLNSVNINVSAPADAYTLPTEQEIEDYRTATGEADATVEDVLQAKILEDLKEGYSDGALGSQKIQITYKPYDSQPANYLEPGKDYEITGRKLDAAGAGAYIEIAGKGNYQDTRKISIPIKKSIADTAIEIKDANTQRNFHYTYTGEVIEPKVKITDGAVELKEGTDYQILGYFDDEAGTTPATADAGDKYIQIKGLGAYATDNGATPPVDVTRMQKYEVAKVNIASDQVKIDLPKQIPGFDASNIQMEVTFNGKPLTQGDDTTPKDYKVEIEAHPSNDPGAFRVTVTGQGNFTGSKTLDTTTGIDISTMNFAFVDTSVASGVDYMGGREVRPAVVLTDGSNVELKMGTDYDLAYSNNKDVGTATVKITGIGNYAGVMTKTFNINAIALDAAKVIYTYSENMPFNAKLASGALVKDVKPAVTISFSGKDSNGEKFTYTLVEGKDYDPITYTNYQAAGNASFTVNAKAGGNFSGSNTLSYTIDPRDVGVAKVGDGNEVAVGWTKTPTYTGSALTGDDLGVYVKHNNATFSNDPSVAAVLKQFYADNFTTQIYDLGNGQAMITVTGKGNYTGMWSDTVKVQPYNISGGRVEIADISPMEYDKANDLTPTPVVTLTDNSSVTLVEGTDYTVSYEDNAEVGDAKVVITGKGNYTGTSSRKFIIYKNLEESEDYADTIALINPIPDQYYTGAGIELKPEDVVLGDILKNNSGRKIIDSKRYTLSNYQNNINVGTASVDVTGAGTYYKGTRTLQFKIVKNDMKNVEVKLDSQNRIFNGSPIEPAVTVTCGGKTLTAGTDYTLLYGNNTNAATREAEKAPFVGVMSLAGGNFGGVKMVYFDIIPKTLVEDALEYTYKYPKDPEKIELENGVYNPIVSVQDVKRGRALTKGTDYTVTCRPIAGEAEKGYLAFTGIGNYQGTVTYEVLLEKQTIQPTLVDVSFTGGQKFTYTGKSVVENPGFNLKVTRKDTGAQMVYGTDYRIVPAAGYNNSQFVNYNDGNKVEFLIEFIGDEFKGTLSGATLGLDFSFVIDQKDISASDVNIVVPNQEAGVKPTVSITYNGMTLIGGTDYEYEAFDYSVDDFNAGKKPYVEVKAKEHTNYKGTKKVYYATGASLLGADVTILHDGYDISNEDPSKYPDGCFIYQGEEIKPRVSVQLGGKPLVQGTDYELTYQDNVDSVAVNENNRGKVIVTGIGSYAGQVTKEFAIAGKNVFDTKGGSVSFGEKMPIEIEFTGSPINPDLKVVFTNKAGRTYNLKPGTDYKIDGSAPTDVGEIQSMTISYFGNFFYDDGNSGKTQSASCKIVPKHFKDVEDETDAGDIYVAWKDPQGEYNFEGQPLTPAYVIKDIKRNTDGTYRENGTLADLASAYTLKPNVDYTAKWKDNDMPGTAELILTGKGNYKDKDEPIKRTFKIKGTLNWANIEFAKPDYPNDKTKKHCFNYTGKPIRPELKIWFGDDDSHTLKAGRSANDPDADYWCEYPLDCTNCGTGKEIIIHGINAYADSGDFTKSYDIVQRDINDAEVETLGSFSYTGEDVRPVPKLYYGGVLLRPDEDYICTWEDPCKKVNDATDPYYTVTVVANPAGNFTGSYTKKEITYKIGDSFTKENGITVTVIQKEYEYIGETIVPKIEVRDKKYQDPLVRGRDYEIAIDEGNPYYINAGKKTFRVYGIEANEPYVGDITEEFTINQVDLSDTTRIKVELENPQNHKYQYYGRPHEPQPIVTWTHPTGTGATTKTVLSADNGDYTYSYANNTDAGTATVTVSEGVALFEGVQPNFTGKKDINFTIHPIQVTEDSSPLKITDLNDGIYTYTGQAIKPNVMIEYDGRPLTEGKDFEITTKPTEAKDIGDYQVEFQFKGNYNGKVVKPFKIVKRSVEDSKVNITIEGGETHKYTGERILPEVKITYDGADLTRGTDYSLEYGENKNAGVGEITITGINNYEGKTTAPFVISPIQINSGDVEIDCDAGVIKNGQPAEPKFTVYWVQEDGTKLKVYAVDDQEAIESGRELAYTYRYTNNTTIGGTGHLEITGTNNFTGTKVVDFFIGADIEQFIDSIEWPNGAPNLTFNNTAQKPEVKVNRTDDAGSASLKEGNDFEIVYEPVSGNADAGVVNAGEYKVFVKGIGKYAGRTNELSYSIAQRNISLVTFTVPDTEFTGSAVKPSITARDEALGLDLKEVAARESKEANAYTTAVTGDTVNAGRVSVAISAVGNGNYKGTVTKDFNITPKNLVGGSVTISPNLIEDQIYTGGAVTPKITIVDTARNAVGEAVSQGQGTYELTAGDCTITYGNNIYPGKATVTIVARGNYTGRLSKEFKINADLSMAEIAPIPVQQYTGSPVTPALTVKLAGKTLTVNRDYTVTYQNNVNRGVATATITATPLGGYTGEKTVTFEIGRDLSGAQVRAVADAFTYTGSPIVPQIAVVYGSDTLRPGVDYSVAYANNVNVGEATVTVTGQGVYSGRVVRTFKIVAKNIARCGFGSVETKLYNGQATSQNFAVTDGGRTLALNQDYRITYVNNSKPGTATIQITGLGNYSGVKTIRYNIEVKPMTAISLSGTTQNSVTLSWTPVDSAEGYAVYNSNNRLVGRTTGTSYTVRQLSAMKSYSYRVRPYVVSDGATYFGDFSNEVSAVTNPPTPSKLKVKAGSRQAKISWKKVSGVNGYEVYRSTKKSSGYKKVATLKKASKTSYTNKKLKTKKKYYFKVRAYKTVNGKKLYSAYSSPKQVKVK